MAVELATAYVSLVPTTKGIQGAIAKEFGGASSAASKAGRESGSLFSKALKGGLVGVGIAAGAAIAGIGAVFKTGIDEQSDFLKGQAQLAAGIKSTGGAAGVSVKQLEDLASSIQDYSGQTDDSIVDTEKLLLTFKNIKNVAGKNNDIFTQATKISADMAARMGGDASQSAIQLGKALNDPTKGLTMLSRIGVTFTAGQTKQIKALQASGHTMDAQKIILKELNSEFGGSAKAAGKTLPGQLARAKRAFEDISQSVVAALMPALTGAATFLSGTLLPALGKFASWATDKIGPALAKAAPIIQKSLGAAVEVVSKTISDLLPIAQNVFEKGLVPAFKVGATAVQRIIKAAQTLAPVFEPVLKMFAKGAGIAIVVAFKALVAVVDKVSGALQPVANFLAKNATVTRTFAVAILAMVSAWAAWKIAVAAWSAVTRVATAVQTAFNTVMDANPITLVILAIVALSAAFVYAYKNSATFRNIIAAAWSGIKTAASVAWAIIKPIFTGFMAYVKLMWTIVKLYFSAIILEWKIAYAAAKTVFAALRTVFGWLVTAAKGVYTGVKLYITAWIKTFNAARSAATSAFSAVRSAIGWVGSAIHSAYSSVTGWGGKIVSYIRGIPGKISGIGGAMAKAGSHLMSSLFSGFKSASGAVGDIGRAIVNSVIGFLNKILPHHIGINKGPIHVNVPLFPNIGYLAKGTDDWRGGLTVVGEQGPELVNLPRHSAVTPAPQTAALLGGKSGNTYQYTIVNPDPYAVLAAAEQREWRSAQR